MTKVIRLTQAHRDRVVGTGDEGSELNPIPYAAGGYILGLQVLDDPAHADVREFLATLPQEEYVPPPADDV